jgi:hypothetical protein
MTELSPDAKKLFDTARAAFSPDEARLKALHGALQARLAAPSATAAAATRVALLTKTTALIGLGLVTAAVISVKTFGPQAVPQAQGHTNAPVAAMAASPAPAAQPPAARVRDDFAVGPSAMPTRVRAQPEAAPAVVADSLSSAARAPVHVARTITQNPTPVARRVPTTSTDSPQAPTVTLETRETPATAQHETTVPEAFIREQQPAPLADNLADELALLRAAHAALERGDAAAALAFLDQHEERFARGILTQERIATRALALCAAGRTSEARSAARGLLRLAPRSPHLARLRASCAWPQTPVE